MYRILTLALFATAALAQDRAPVFIETEDVETMLMVRSEPDLKLFDCSVNDNSLLAFHANHLPTANFIDLNYFRNMTNKYPFMLPGVQ